MRYFFHIAYNGFNYHGWQKLPQANSIQAVIETQLQKILKTAVAIVGCGRTDSQVHASQYFFHADIQTKWEFDLVDRLNKNLPDDIAVFDIRAMEGTPHARLDAEERTYTYFIHTYKDPYLTNISSYYPVTLNFDEMKRAVTLLPHHHDYYAFCRNAPMHRTTTCDVSRADLHRNENGTRIKFEISANRFLYGMIRIIMQKLLLVGQGRLSYDEFEHHLSSKEVFKVRKGAYPQGLYLSQVKYPFLTLPSRSELFNRMADGSHWETHR